MHFFSKYPQKKQPANWFCMFQKHTCYRSITTSSTEQSFLSRRRTKETENDVSTKQSLFFFYAYLFPVKYIVVNSNQIKEAARFITIPELRTRKNIYIIGRLIYLCLLTIYARLTRKIISVMEDLKTSR